MSSFDTVLAGLGGQGILLVSRVLVEEALQRGLPVRGAETHGMAQRGGPVLAHVRVGQCSSPLVVPGTADVLVALERLEGLRNLRYLRSGGLLLVNSPDLDFLGAEAASYLRRREVDVVHLDASRMASEAGNPLSVNIIMAGAAAARPATPLDMDSMRKAVTRVAHPRFLEASLEALESGYAAGKGGGVG